MNSFKVYFEDFNNWRAPVNASQSGPDLLNFSKPDANPTGFKGAQGSTFGGSETGVGMKIPKKKTKKSNHQKLVQILKKLKRK